LMLAACTSGAAYVASSYTGGGKSDWFLPSKNELNELFLQRAVVGGFVSDQYWSSSDEAGSGTHARSQHFGTGGEDAWQKEGVYCVRPIRAF
jgi:hypothetical protein